VPPIGLKTITQPIDKFFEEKLDGVSFQRLKKYIQPYYIKAQADLTGTYANDLNSFETFVIGELKKYSNSPDKVAAFTASDAIEKAKTSDDVIWSVLREFGKTIFESVFTK
jgi:hypothetical protein